MKVKIHALFEYLLETAREAPEAVLGFSLAEPPRLGEFLAELDPNLSLDWSNQSFQGMPALRERILDAAGLRGVCGVEDVLVTAGAAEANFLAITQLVHPGDELILETPGWPQPAVLGEALGARLRLIERREAAGWRLDLDELAALINPQTRLIFLSNPNNPTGQVLREAELAEIARLAGRVGVYLLVDEAYAGLEWSGGRVPAAAGFYERAITTGSVSKGLGLQGLRTGWLICREPRVIFDAVVLRENTSEIMNILGEAIAEIALRPHRLGPALERARADGREKLARLNAFIDGRPELSWIPPPAGLIGLCRLHLPIDGETLARRLLLPPYRTFLIPGSAYGCPQHIRLGVGGGAAVELEKGIERLARFLDALA